MHSGSRFNPAIFFIVFVVAIVIFFSGLVILLVKLINKQRLSSIFQSNTSLDISGSSVLQRQLQNLFNLHDSGLDQAIIDSLPVFIYKDIMGLNSPFDCPVCLCEFTDEDKLRLLPLCKHAFHLQCIDTWLLSSSTCPLCRSTLLKDPSFELDDYSRNADGFSLNVSDSDITVQKPDEPDHVVTEKRVFSLRLGKFRHNTNEDIEMGESSSSSNKKIDQKRRFQKPDEWDHVVTEKRVFSLRLDKFRRNTDEDIETGESNSSSSSSNKKIDSRRCFSMDYVQYVVDDKEFQVALCCDESRDNDDLKLCSINDGKSINNGNKRESFSISKVWLWPKKSKEKHFSMSFNTRLSNAILQSSMEESSDTPVI